MLKAGYSIADISAIKALPTALIPDGYARLCRSVNSWFTYNPTSTTTANDVSVLLPSSGTGRWFRAKADVISADITDLTETIDDRVDSLLVNSTTISKTYNDGANTLALGVIAGSIGDTQVSSLSQSKITNLSSDLATKLSSNQNITLSGDVIGNGATSITAVLANTSVIAGSYANANVTVDSKGRITAASDGTENIQDTIASTLIAGTNVTLSYNDTAGTLTVNASGSGEPYPDKLVIYSAVVQPNQSSTITGNNFFTGGSYVVLVNGIQTTNIAVTNLTTLTFTAPIFSDLQNIRVYGSNGYGTFVATNTSLNWASLTENNWININENNWRGIN